MRKHCCLVLAVSVCLLLSTFTYAERSIELVGDPSVGTNYMLYDEFGGTWHDAEKSSDNTQDDLMCWAAAASNMLAWGGWGQPGVTGTSGQDIFQYYQDHWTDAAGDARYGIDWWFSGVNPKQGQSGYSQVDVQGGGFYPNLNSSSYMSRAIFDSYLMDNIDNYFTQGKATALWLGQYPGGGISHMITCWGVNYTQVDDLNRTYHGVWVTDSDDNKTGEAPRDEWLRYYDIEYDETYERWYLQDYFGHDDVFIGVVTALAPNPNPVPEPATLTLLAMGGLVVMIRRKRRRA